MLLIFVYHHYEIFPVDERPREQVICQLGVGGCIPGAPSGSRLSTGNRRLGTTVFPVDGIGLCCCSCIQIFFILLRGALAGITHELPCPRVHRSLLTKTIKLNDASSDASPGQKLVFFSSGASRNCCVVIMMINQKVFRPQAPK